jgi:hypothetical protein
VNSTILTLFNISRARRIIQASSRQRSEQNRFLFLIGKDPALQNGFSLVLTLIRHALFIC